MRLYFARQRACARCHDVTARVDVALRDARRCRRLFGSADCSRHVGSKGGKQRVACAFLIGLRAFFFFRLHCVHDTARDKSLCAMRQRESLSHAMSPFFTRKDARCQWFDAAMVMRSMRFFAAFHFDSFSSSAFFFFFFALMPPCRHIYGDAAARCATIRWLYALLYH